ncbi:unnamed protein product [Rhodiola kirilowii]
MLSVKAASTLQLCGTRGSFNHGAQIDIIEVVQV